MSYTLAYTGAEIDALLGKIDAIFVAEYGSTIYSEVTAAIAAGNKVIVANAGKVYVYAGQDDNGGYVFTQSGPNAAKPNATYVTLSTGNVWSTATVDLATLQQFYASLMEDTASGSIASFPDGAENVPVKELTADIEPIQDLHGQASPWPAGGGLNKLDTSTFTTETIYGVTFTQNSDGSIRVKGVATGNARKYITINLSLSAVSCTLGYWTGTKRSANANAAIVDTVSGQACIVTSNTSSTTQTLSGTFNQFAIYVANGVDIDATFYPMLSEGAATDYVPYSNICPISGYTGAEISVTGTNIWDEEWEQGGIDDTTGAKTPSGTQIRGKNYIPCKGSTNYYVEGQPGTVSVYIYYYDAAKNFIGRAIVGGAYSVVRKTITTPANAAFMMMKAGTLTSYGNDISINYPSTDHDYHSGADNTTYSVSWTDEGTVYKGNLNATTGVLTVTHALWTKNTSTMNNIESVPGWTNAGMKAIVGEKASGGLVTALMNIGTQYGENVTPGNDIVYLPTILYGKTQTEWIALAMDVQILAKYATPQTYQLTPTEVQTLLGDNNIWSNTGDISVKYRANTALYIEKKLGE